MHSLGGNLQALISSASVPELKEALRIFEARCSESREFSQNLLGRVTLEERKDRDVLRNVVKSICERFEECREVVEELLGVDEDEYPRRDFTLDECDEEERECEVEVVRRKRKKIDSLSPPTRRTKKIQFDFKNRTAINEKDTPFQRTPSQGTAKESCIQSKTSTPSQSAPLSSAPKRKRTIAEIFEADKQRREREALQEAQRLKEEAEIRATCAQCGKFFLTDDNPDSSCVFHSGTTRNYQPADERPNYRWFCCGRESQDEGCMEAKHIDDRIPGEIERIKAILKSAWEESSAVIYRSCEECDKDTVVDSESENSERDETELAHSEVDESVSAQGAKRFLCYRCIEETAAKHIQCTTCGEEFKALPSHDAYTAGKPVCGECEWADTRRGQAICSKCWKTFKPPKRPYWYEFDDGDGDGDGDGDDLHVCAECEAKELEEGEGGSVEGC